MQDDIQTTLIRQLLIPKYMSQVFESDFQGITGQWRRAAEKMYLLHPQNLSLFRFLDQVIQSSKLK